ncbi:MAG: hypothetical protein JWQ94_2922 [Tardiphaga sp.]|jgi:hypothetical protein|nr:hypothetical protein [Tardiphaga sp.]
MHGSSLAQTSHFHFRVFTNGAAPYESDALDFDDLDEVWHEGAMSACEIIRAMHGRIEGDLDWRLEVSDAAGKVIYRFSFKAERL